MGGPGRRRRRAVRGARTSRAGPIDLAHWGQVTGLVDRRRARRRGHAVPRRVPRDHRRGGGGRRGADDHGDDRAAEPARPVRGRRRRVRDARGQGRGLAGVARRGRRARAGSRPGRPTGSPQGCSSGTGSHGRGGAPGACRRSARLPGPGRVRRLGSAGRGPGARSRPGSSTRHRGRSPRRRPRGASPARPTRCCRASTPATAWSRTRGRARGALADLRAAAALADRQLAAARDVAEARAALDWPLDILQKVGMFATDVPGLDDAILAVRAGDAAPRRQAAARIRESVAGLRSVGEQRIALGAVLAIVLLACLAVAVRRGTRSPRGRGGRRRGRPHRWSRSGRPSRGGRHRRARRSRQPARRVADPGLGPAADPRHAQHGRRPGPDRGREAREAAPTRG